MAEPLLRVRMALGGCGRSSLGVLSHTEVGKGDVGLFTISLLVGHMA